jgi:hypothetical protein
MILASNRRWWAGYVALTWSACLVVPILCAEMFGYKPELYSYIYIASLCFSPLGLYYAVFAMRRGSPLAKGAAILALLAAVLFIVYVGFIYLSYSVH